MGTPVIYTEARWENGTKEVRFNTGPPSDEYLTWIGDYLDDCEAVGIAP